MQDRLRFRAWDKANKKMYKVICLNCHRQDEIIVSGLYGTKYIKNIAWDDCNILQCTGLEDKNGKLIYEGDILFEKCINVIYPNGKFWVVKWNDKHAEFYIDLINPAITGHFANQWHLARHDLDYEVIGNIYEDSQLLEKEIKNDK